MRDKSEENQEEGTPRPNKGTDRQNGNGEAHQPDPQEPTSSRGTPAEPTTPEEPATSDEGSEGSVYSLGNCRTCFQVSGSVIKLHPKGKGFCPSCRRRLFQTGGFFVSYNDLMGPIKNGSNSDNSNGNLAPQADNRSRESNPPNHGVVNGRKKRRAKNGNPNGSCASKKNRTEAANNHGNDFSAPANSLPPYFICPECLISLEDKDSFKFHMEEFHCYGRRRSFQCPACDHVPFCCREDLYSHIMSHNFPGAYRNANRGAAWGSDLERAHQRGIRPITVVLGQERQHPSERSRHDHLNELHPTDNAVPGPSSGCRIRRDDPDSPGSPSPPEHRPPQPRSHCPKKGKLLTAVFKKRLTSCKETKRTDSEKKRAKKKWSRLIIISSSSEDNDDERSDKASTAHPRTPPASRRLNGATEGDHRSDLENGAEENGVADSALNFNARSQANGESQLGESDDQDVPMRQEQDAINPNVEVGLNIGPNGLVNMHNGAIPHRSLNRLLVQVPNYGENLHPLSSRNAGPVEAASHLSDDNDSGNGGSDSSRQSPEEPAASTSFARLANFGGVLAMVGGTGGADNFPMERENNASENGNRVPPPRDTGAISNVMNNQGAGPSQNSNNVDHEIDHDGAHNVGNVGEIGLPEDQGDHRGTSHTDNVTACDDQDQVMDDENASVHSSSCNGDDIREGEARRDEHFAAEFPTSQEIRMRESLLEDSKSPEEDAGNLTYKYSIDDDLVDMNKVNHQSPSEYEYSEETGSLYHIGKENPEDEAAPSEKYKESQGNEIEGKDQQPYYGGHRLANLFLNENENLFPIDDYIFYPEIGKGEESPDCAEHIRTATPPASATSDGHQADNHTDFDNRESTGETRTTSEKLGTNTNIGDGCPAANTDPQAEASGISTVSSVDQVNGTEGVAANTSASTQQDTQQIAGSNDNEVPARGPQRQATEQVAQVVRFVPVCRGGGSLIAFIDLTGDSEEEDDSSRSDSPDLVKDEDSDHHIRGENTNTEDGTEKDENEARRGNDVGADETEKDIMVEVSGENDDLEREQSELPQDSEKDERVEVGNLEVVADVQQPDKDQGVTDEQRCASNEGVEGVTQDDVEMLERQESENEMAEVNGAENLRKMRDDGNQNREAISNQSEGDNRENYQVAIHEEIGTHDAVIRDQGSEVANEDDSKERNEEDGNQEMEVEIEGADQDCTENPELRTIGSRLVSVENMEGNALPHQNNGRSNSRGRKDDGNCPGANYSVDETSRDLLAKVMDLSEIDGEFSQSSSAELPVGRPTSSLLQITAESDIDNSDETSSGLQPSSQINHNLLEEDKQADEQSKEIMDTLSSPSSFSQSTENTGLQQSPPVSTFLLNYDRDSDTPRLVIDEDAGRSDEGETSTPPESVESQNQRDSVIQSRSRWMETSVPATPSPTVNRGNGILSPPRNRKDPFPQFKRLQESMIKDGSGCPRNSINQRNTMTFYTWDGLSSQTPDPPSLPSTYRPMVEPITPPPMPNPPLAPPMVPEEPSSAARLRHSRSLLIPSPNQISINRSAITPERPPVVNPPPSRENCPVPSGPPPMAASSRVPFSRVRLPPYSTFRLPRTLSLSQPRSRAPGQPPWQGHMSHLQSGQVLVRPENQHNPANPNSRFGTPRPDASLRPQDHPVLPLLLDIPTALNEGRTNIALSLRTDRHHNGFHASLQNNGVTVNIPEGVYYYELPDGTLELRIAEQTLTPPPGAASMLPPFPPNQPHGFMPVRHQRPRVPPPAHERPMLNMNMQRDLDYSRPPMAHTQMVGNPRMPFALPRQMVPPQHPPPHFRNPRPIYHQGNRHPYSLMGYRFPPVPPGNQHINMQGPHRRHSGPGNQNPAGGLQESRQTHSEPNPRTQQRSLTQEEIEMLLRQQQAGLHQPEETRRRGEREQQVLNLSSPTGLPLKKRRQ